MDELEELRQLLLGPEQEQLGALRARVEDKDKRVEDVSGVLPQAARLSNERSTELSRALQPTVGDSIRDAIKSRPAVFIEAFHPIIGPLIRRSIAESLRGLMQSLNQTLEHTLSWQGMKWRFEAMRTGRSFGEIVMLRSLVYRVEQIFLIHRDTSLLLLHVSADPAAVKDSDMVAGMLSAIQDFSRDSFQAGAGASLEEFRVGELQVWIASGKDAYVAASIRGNPPRELHATLEEAIDNVHILRGPALSKFDGDASMFEPLRPDLEACLRTQFAHDDAARPSMTKAWVALAIVFLLAGFVTYRFFRSERRWHNMVHLVDAEPGLAVTDAHRNWFSVSRVSGLRDPLAADPVPLIRQAGVDPAGIEFEWKSFLAMDETSVRRRFDRRFGVPADARIQFAGHTVEISGSAPYEWIERVRREHLQVEGVNLLAERNLKITYDPALTLERFRSAFPPPAGVTARVADGTLHLSGKAAYEWLTSVREGATHVAGIQAIADRDLKVDFDPALVLRRFEDRFGLPDTARATVRDGVLALSGEVSHSWLARVHKAATELPGIQSVDERNLSDLDVIAFQRSKSVIEHAFVYFLPGKDNLATEGFAALSRLPDEIRRCQTAARHTGTDVTIEIRGSADAVGNEAKNLELSERRARAVRDFLVSCGLDAAILKQVAVAPPQAPDSGAKPLPEESARRVEFRVVATP